MMNVSEAGAVNRLLAFIAGPNGNTEVLARQAALFLADRASATLGAGANGTEVAGWWPELTGRTPGLRFRRAAGATEVAPTAPRDGGALSIDELLDQLCDWRVQLGGAAPVAAALDGAGYQAVIVRDLSYGLLEENAASDDSGENPTYQVLSDDGAGPQALVALVLYPVVVRAAGEASHA